jgi:hypothetical protein
MTDYEKIIKRLEQQNMNPDTTAAQKEANNFRVQWLKKLHREKPSVTKTTFYDPIQERLAHGYAISPSSLLHD